MFVRARIILHENLRALKVSLTEYWTTNSLLYTSFLMILLFKYKKLSILLIKVSKYKILIVSFYVLYYKVNGTDE
jgi:hypothetical protein